MAEELQKAAEGLLRCNKCGLCLAGCPIYKVTGIEWMAARGRLALLQNTLDNQVRLDELKEPIFNCLTCNGCTDHCPSGVKTDEFIFKARADMVKEEGQSPIKRFLFEQIQPQPSRIKVLVNLIGLTQVSGLRSAARGLGITKLLGKIGEAEPILPTVPFRHNINNSSSPKLEHPKYKVAYFAGCVPSNLSPQVAEAAIRVLNRHNVEVLIPDFVCCGMPAYGYGYQEAGCAMAKKNIDVAISLEVDAIITTCASCGSLLKRYQELLSEDAEYSSRASAFSKKVKDISEFLPEIGLITEMGTLDHKVTYHDPCHLGRFQKVTSQPRKILQSIPGVEFIEAAESNMCCGAAGTYNIGHHDLSMKVLACKMNNVSKTGADLLVTCCPGCSMQLAYGVKKHDLKMKTMELVELLDLAYRSVPQRHP